MPKVVFTKLKCDQFEVSRTVCVKLENYVTFGLLGSIRIVSLVTVRDILVL